MVREMDPSELIGYLFVIICVWSIWKGFTWKVKPDEKEGPLEEEKQLEEGDIEARAPNKIIRYLVVAIFIVASGYCFYVVFTQFTLPPEPPLPDFVTTNFQLAVYDELGTYNNTHGWLGEYIIDLGIGEGDRYSTGFISREEPFKIDFRFENLRIETIYLGYMESLTVIITEPHQTYTLYDYKLRSIGDPFSYYWSERTGEPINQTHRPHVVFEYDPTHLDIHDEIEIYVSIGVMPFESHSLDELCSHDYTLKLKTVSEDEHNILEKHLDWQQTKRNLESDDHIRAKNNYIIRGSISLILGLIGIFWETSIPNPFYRGGTEDV